MGTDTRGLCYNKDIFAQAGLPADWQPKTWDDMLAAAETIKEKVPDVIPLNVYAGKAAGEATTMQGFEMLLYGTEGHALRRRLEQVGASGSQGFTDSLGFIDDRLPGGASAPPLDQRARRRRSATASSTELLPQGKLAIALDGSWVPGGWISGDNAVARVGQDDGHAPRCRRRTARTPGVTSMSGGWTLAVGAQRARTRRRRSTSSPRR